MTSTDIKAAFFDIDGTLTSFTTHVVPESTISAMLLPRGAVCVVKAVVFGLVLPKLCARVRRALPGEGEKTHGA